MCVCVCVCVGVLELLPLLPHNAVNTGLQQVLRLGENQV
jgi:hypothetical protein